MLRAYQKFQVLLNDTKNTEVLYTYITQNTKIPLDCDDLLRWEWAQCVSAFDTLMHDLIRIGILQIYNGQRPTTLKFNGYVIDYQTYKSMTDYPTNAQNIFEQKVILKLKTLSFQAPDKVSDGLSFIWLENDKWGKIANYIGMNKNDCVTMMKNIVTRRNQIVHEGDYVDHLSQQRQAILFPDVIDTKEFIQKVGEAIFNLVK